MKTPVLNTFLIALTLIFWGCSDGDDTLKTTGGLNIFLVDAPFPTDQVAEANVTVFKVEARLSDRDFEEDSESMEEVESKGGYITLMDENMGPLNLLDLVNGVSEQLVSAEVPAGTYDLIRVYVRDPNIVMKEGSTTTYDLKVPSGAQSGIKVFLDPPLEVVGGLSEDLTLDFDVSQSFVPKGGSANNPDGITGFNFTPVIRASITSTTGTLSGKVLIEGENGPEPPGEQIAVRLYNLDDTEAATTVTDPDGNGGYSISIEPGIYRLEASLDGYETQSVDGVEVILNNRTTLEDIVLIPLPETNTGG